MKEKKIKNQKTKKLTNIGQQYIDIAAKPNFDTVDVKELGDTLHKDYMANLEESAKRGVKAFDGDFFIEIRTKPEKLISTVLRNYFYPRLTCPTPSYDQTVYKYNHKLDELEFIWVVPSKKICNDLYANRHDLNHINDPLLPYVIDFSDGSMYIRMKKLNKEIKG